ncbi:hypothetical protein BOTBODRAFT_170856 [Botryobasidium botryosum FD-172 SS1]|uniref:Uncharacterized protein n=1 Tax=Botryobasidium botryosum (strain FD-172 SS1) TaxID=930990 RepID=A0A067MT20_BOTB1|nr:hypothetical protein BOTBODRAFT_170856 [Botryobasidium botryosum FD-172 SS1]
MSDSDDESTAIGHDAQELVESINSAPQLFPVCLTTYSTLHPFTMASRRLKVIRRSGTIEKYASALFKSTLWVTVHYALCHAFTEETTNVGLDSSAFVSSWAVGLDSTGAKPLNFARVDPIRLLKLAAKTSGIYTELKKRGATKLNLELPKSGKRYHLGHCVDGEPVADGQNPMPPPILVPVPRARVTSDPIAFCVMVTVEEGPMIQDSNKTDISRSSTLHDLQSPRVNEIREGKKRRIELTTSDDEALVQIPARKQSRVEPRESQNPIPSQSSAQENVPSSRRSLRLRRRVTPSPPPAEASSPPPSLPTSHPSPSPPPRPPLYVAEHGYVIKVLGIKIAKPFPERSSATLNKAVALFSNLNTWKTQKGRPAYLTRSEYA